MHLGSESTPRGLGVGDSLSKEFWWQQKDELTHPELDVGPAVGCKIDPRKGRCWEFRSASSRQLADEA